MVGAYVTVTGNDTMKHSSIALGVALNVLSVISVSPLAAFETPQATAAQAVLGTLAVGPNYNVDPDVRSDGLMHIYIVNTNYGRFQVSGDSLMKQRIQELRALDALEKISNSDVFAKSAAQAAGAPLRFGFDLITKPGDTIGRSMSGVANMFDAAGASLQNQGARRDTMANSMLGVDAARRQIAVELGVDPYTDFAPLTQKLQEIAGNAALGGLSVRVALSAIPGGVGTVVSGSSSINSIKDTLRDKTSAQIIQSVRQTLRQLHVPNDAISRFVENRNYTPADLLATSRALARLNARNTAVFIERAAEARSRDVAFFQRRRAELLVEQTTGVTEFISVGGFPLNRTNVGNVIAVFPLDDVAWTAYTARAFSAVTDQIRRAGIKNVPILATTGAVTSTTESEIKKLGWRIVQLR
jgi:hypothetical protein